MPLNLKPMSLWEYILLFFSVLFGGSAGFFFKKDQTHLLQLVLSFSGAYILGITVLHLMPEVYKGGDHQIGLWMLGGFFVQLLLEQLSVGVEHGHIHAPHRLSTGFVVSVMLGLSIHAFVEGIPLSYFGEMEAVVHHGHNHNPNHLLYGIILHHIPAALALVILLKVSGVKKRTIWICLAIFAAMSPLGALLASTTFIPDSFQTGILAFAVGSLLHIATVILFEMDGSNHQIPRKKLIAILLGTTLAIFTSF